ncbi:hypothetical protein [Cryptosporangium sp. NPDC048952]|uniref:hypothetical protein n=1 Tax=Cryptosporangium sp. NPDC048952 TaxID=3363961 RepID=UPI00371C82A6
MVRHIWLAVVVVIVGGLVLLGVAGAPDAPPTGIADHGIYLAENPEINPNKWP